MKAFEFTFVATTVRHKHIVKVTASDKKTALKKALEEINAPDAKVVLKAKSPAKQPFALITQSKQSVIDWAWEHGIGSSRFVRVFVLDSAIHPVRNPKLINSKRRLKFILPFGRKTHVFYAGETDDFYLGGTHRAARYAVIAKEIKKLGPKAAHLADQPVKMTNLCGIPKDDRLIVRFYRRTPSTLN